MRTHTFRLVLDRPPTDLEHDALAEICGDGGFETGGLHVDWAAAVEFDRVAPTLDHAIASAIADIEASSDLKILAVRPTELVRDEDIATRAGMDLRSLTQRILMSSAVYPKPTAIGRTEAPFYQWSQARGWLAAHGVETDYDATIAAADQTLSNIHVRDAGALEREIGAARDWAARWTMPEWMTRYVDLIHGCAPDQIEKFLYRLQHERNLAFTNIVVFSMCMDVKSQVDMLQRLHAAGLLADIPNPPGE